MSILDLIFDQPKTDRLDKLDLRPPRPRLRKWSALGASLWVSYGGGYFGMGKTPKQAEDDRRSRPSEKFDDNTIERWFWHDETRLFRENCRAIEERRGWYRVHSHFSHISYDDPITYKGETA
jgi:hypothetical protein